MADMSSMARDKRVQFPRKVFSPSSPSSPVPSNYLIYMMNTESYLIVARSSVKKVQGNKATLFINNKKFDGEIIVSGSYTRCQSELNKIQQTSQPSNNELHEFNKENEIDFNSGNYDSQSNGLTDKENEYDQDEDEQSSEIDESDDELLFSRGTSKKRKFADTRMLSQRPRQIKRRKPEPCNEINELLDTIDDTRGQAKTTKRIASTENHSIRSMEKKINHLSKNIVRMSNVIRQVSSSSLKTGGHNLDCYRDSNSNEIFPSTVDYEGQNLIAIVGKDFGDYARHVLRVLYTIDELRTCILPPKRAHLTREALDPVRFRLLHEAVRAKYRLAPHMYDDFYKYHLGPKLGDFLVEERRREATKNARKQAKLNLLSMTTEQQWLNNNN